MGSKMSYYHEVTNPVHLEELKMVFKPLVLEIMQKNDMVLADMPHAIIALNCFGIEECDAIFFNMFRRLHRKNLNGQMFETDLEYDDSLVKAVNHILFDNPHPAFVEFKNAAQLHFDTKFGMRNMPLLELVIFISSDFEEFDFGVETTRSDAKLEKCWSWI